MNLAHMVSFENHVLLLADGEKIPVSRRQRIAFQLVYMKYDTKDYMV